MNEQKSREVEKKSLEHPGRRLGRTAKPLMALAAVGATAMLTAWLVRAKAKRGHTEA